MNKKVAEKLALLTNRLTKLDKLFDFYVRLREEIILLLGDEEFFQAYNDIAYSQTKSYLPSSHNFRDKLFTWEKTAIETYFPPPPAHILVGGAGGGREVFSLADLGYQITAFEPCPSLVKAMDKEAQKRNLPVKVYSGRFQDLWTPPKQTAQHNKDIDSTSPPQLPLAQFLPQFQGIILGWGALTHLTSKPDRENLFKACFQLLDSSSPLLASYFAKNSRSSKQAKKTLTPKKLLSILKTKARSFRGIDQGAVFVRHAGFAHAFTETEIKELAKTSSLSPVFITHNDGVYSHSVFKKP